MRNTEPPTYGHRLRVFWCIGGIRLIFVALVQPISKQCNNYTSDDWCDYELKQCHKHEVISFHARCIEANQMTSIILR